MSRVSAELGEGHEVIHWREQHEHRPALAAWANRPGAESSVAGPANLQAPTPRPSDLGGLICMAQAQGPGLGCVYRVRQRCGKTEKTPSAAFGFCWPQQGLKNILTSNKGFLFLRIATLKYTTWRGWAEVKLALLAEASCHHSLGFAGTSAVLGRQEEPTWKQDPQTGCRGPGV